MVVGVLGLDNSQLKVLLENRLEIGLSIVDGTVE
jgi:hypothetical protein